MLTATNRRYLLLFLALTLCTVFDLPACRDFMGLQKEGWFSFSSSTTEKKKGGRSTNSNCPQPYFWEALAAFTKALHDDPVSLGARPWSWNISSSSSSNPITTTSASPTCPTCVFDGISSRLIHQAFKGKRIALVGDSTLFFMHRWMQTVAMDMSGRELDSLEHIPLDQANQKVKTRILTHEDTFQRQTIQDAASAKPHSTSIVWHGYKGTTWENACQFDDNFWGHVRQARPHIMVVNFGLHWLHLQGGGRDVPACYPEWWSNYESWLEKAFQVAQESGTKLLLFKTTNFFCEKLFTGKYKDTIARFKEERNQLQSDLLQISANHSNNDKYQLHPATPMFNLCVEQLDRKVKYNATPTMAQLLSQETLYRYCSEGTFDEAGSRRLNARVADFVRKKTQEPQQTASVSRKDKTETFVTAPTIAIFNDHDLQSCRYSQMRDGRHYNPLNLLRLRVLANMIQALYDNKS